jgi:hypothetical protein
MKRNKYLDPKKYIINLSLRLSGFISKWEKKKITKYGNQPLKHQPVFIIGAPRTGSTILYQILTNQLDVLYIDNLSCIFRKNFFYGFWLSNKLYKQKAHNNFKSYHGNTTQHGLRAPSECGGYWYRWLPKDHHFIDYDEITAEMVNEIRNEITAVINYFDKPIVFKNLNAGQRMRLLTRCFPEAKFIFIRRDLLMTAQSILIAKRKLGYSDNEFWSIKPKNAEQLTTLSSTEQIIKQIYYLEKQIVEDQKLVLKNNFWSLNYEKLPSSQLINAAKKFIDAEFRKDTVFFEFKINNNNKLNREDTNEFKRLIDELDWKTYGLS